MREMDVLRLDVTPWEVTDALMRERQQERIRGEREDLIIFVEHPEVVTVGPRARSEGHAPPADYATASTDRGGGLTWHGPGQLVVYPVVHWDLDGEANVAAVIHRLEAWVILALAEVGIEGHRDERMQGVWVAGRKVCSIGLSFLRWVSRHGLTVNLDTPSGRVEALAGCGLQPDMTTSLRALGHHVERETLVDALLKTAPQALVRDPR
ncbi:MAG: lipoyl(octanoyl) transferase LipB [Candidatus Poseidoniaceae archaeon]